MIEVFGAVVGFVSSIIPTFFKFIQDRSNKKHELALLNMKLEAQKNQESGKLEILKLQADKDESATIYKNFYTGNKKMDALNASVRPVLAYAFFFLYVGAKLFYVFRGEEFYLEKFWSTVDNTIFLTIIAFFYGQRAMQKAIEK